MKPSNFHLYIVALVFLTSQSLACEEHLVQDSPKKTYYDNFYFRSSPVSFTKNVTIICSNLESLQQIQYTFVPKAYDQFFQIANSTIRTLPSEAFASFSTITKLYLSANGIEYIQAGAFSGLSTLKDLYLNNNSLKRIESAVFISLDHLLVLDLSHNRIETVEKLAFMGLYSLVKLNLKANKISNVNGVVFDQLENLKELDLSTNPLKMFSWNNLPALDFLNLSQTLLDVSDLSVNVSVINLDLTNCQIREIDFQKLPKCKKLKLSKNRIANMKNCENLNSNIIYLDNNNINSINCTFKNLIKIDLSYNQLINVTESIFKDSINVQYVDLSHNNISHIDNKSFHELLSLKYLNLQNNAIRKIDTVLFKDLPNLLQLNLSNNQIEEFQYGTFNNLKQLVVLDISGNKLKDLHQFTLSALSQLQMLYFDNNNISSVQETALKAHLPLLQFVSFDKNPWLCEDLVKIEKGFKAAAVNVQRGTSEDVENVNGIACSNRKVVKKNNDTEFVKEIIAEIIAKSKISELNADFENFIQTVEPKDETNVDKLTSMPDFPTDYSPTIFICFVIVQIVVLLFMLGLVYLIFKFLKEQLVKNTRRNFGDFPHLEMY